MSSSQIHEIVMELISRGWNEPEHIAKFIDELNQRLYQPPKP